MGIRETILEADRAGRRKPVEVPEWGGVTVYVHRFALSDRLDLARLPESMDDAARIAWAIVRAVHDESGAPVFTSEDIGELAGQADGSAVRRVWDAVRDVCKLAQSADELEAEKNV